MEDNLYCPYCNEAIDLEKDRISPGHFECPSCGEVIEVRQIKATN
jgi:predicted RNA-binding Zn-ribbon protein involved in translation (DUF1610 family)